MMKLALKKLKSNILMKFCCSYSSSLYVTGDKAQKVFSILVPHIDFEERLENREELLHNITARKLELDLADVEKTWYFYRRLLEKKRVLDQTRIEIGRQLKELGNNVNTQQNESERLKIHGRMIKEDLKTLREHMYSVEESAALKVLNLPNVLHKKTPTTEPTLLYQFLEKPTDISESHMLIAKNNNLVEYQNSLYYFLNHECALFEFNIVNYFQNNILNHSFTQLSNPDFTRSIVVEGCAGDFKSSNEYFTIENTHDCHSSSLSRLHLVGGSSLYAFMSYFTKHFLQIGYFPIKFFSCGRKYHPPINSDESLFNVSQETAIELFIATKDLPEDQDDEIENVITIFKEQYDSLGLHYILLALPAHKLKNHESMRISLQMYSCFLQRYVEVAHLSVCGNFLSKRLLCTYSEEKIRKFPKILSGTILSVQKLLGCLIEYNSISNKNLLYVKSVNQ